MPLYLPGAPGAFRGDERLVAPYHPAHAQSAVAHTINQLRFCRVVVPVDGEIRDISVGIGATSGNLILAVYDDGTASAGNYTRLWTSASTVMGAANSYQTIDPGAGVIPCYAGQALYFGEMADNVTATVARLSTFASNYNLPPTGFMPTIGGALPKLGAILSQGSFAASTPIAEASMLVNNTVPLIIARVG